MSSIGNMRMNMIVFVMLFFATCNSNQQYFARIYCDNCFTCPQQGQKCLFIDGGVFESTQIGNQCHGDCKGLPLIVKVYQSKQCQPSCSIEYTNSQGTMIKGCTSVTGEYIVDICRFDNSWPIFLISEVAVGGIILILVILQVILFYKKRRINKKQKQSLIENE